MLEENYDPVTAKLDDILLSPWAPPNRISSDSTAFIALRNSSSAQEGHHICYKPIVFRHRGKLMVVDGNKRVMVAANDGRKQMAVRVVKDPHFTIHDAREMYLRLNRTSRKLTNNDYLGMFLEDPKMPLGPIGSECRAAAKLVGEELLRALYDTKCFGVVVVTTIRKIVEHAEATHASSKAKKVLGMALKTEGLVGIRSLLTMWRLVTPTGVHTIPSDEIIVAACTTHIPNKEVWANWVRLSNRRVLEACAASVSKK